MEELKLFDSELKLMEIIWDNSNSQLSAKEISIFAKEQIGWNKNTTYTILKKLVEKNAIKREEPNFICIPLITKEQVQKVETDNLINKLFNGSKKAFFSAFVGREKLTKKEVEELLRIIEESGK